MSQCLCFAGNPVMPLAFFPAYLAQADFPCWDSRCQPHTRVGRVRPVTSSLNLSHQTSGCPSLRDWSSSDPRLPLCPPLPPLITMPCGLGFRRRSPGAIRSCSASGKGQKPLLETREERTWGRRRGPWEWGSLSTALNPRSAPLLALSLSGPICKTGLMTSQGVRREERSGVWHVSCWGNWPGNGPKRP